MLESSLDVKRALDDAETPADVARILRQSGARVVNFPKSDAPAVYIVGDFVVEWDGKDAYPAVETVYNWLSDADLDNYFPNYQQRWNDDFWSHPTIVYHATQPERLDAILRNGLAPRDETRGISNRGVGAAVFTTIDEDEAMQGHYGAVVLRIDTVALAHDPDRPYASQEPPVLDATYREALAHRMGIEDYNDEIETGLSDTTVILYGTIPPRYLSVSS